MEERLLLRIEELSRTVSDLIGKREQAINDLRRIDSDIDSISMVIFELKSLLESEEPSVD
jgi:hypothetical protein